MAERARVPALGRACYALTALGVAAHGHLLFDPPASGNGLTTLPLVVFLLLATGGSVLGESRIGASKLRESLLRNRRAFGICAGVWAVAHALTKGALSLAIQPEGLVAHLVRPEILAAGVALFVLFLLLLTSNDRSRRALGRRWKKLHRLVWLVPGIALVHGQVASMHFTTEQQMNLPVLVPLLVTALLPAFLWLRGTGRGHQRRVGYLLIGAALAGSLVVLLDGGPAVSVLQD